MCYCVNITGDQAKYNPQCKFTNSIVIKNVTHSSEDVKHTLGN